jgi:hypothetical protein
VQLLEVSLTICRNTKLIMLLTEKNDFKKGSPFKVPGFGL